MSETIIEQAEAKDPHKVSWKQLLLYAAPPAGMGYMFCLVTLYLLPYSTEVLGIGAGIMGFILGMSRVWDAVSDPLVGYLSDRTQTRWGRRRPWIFASIIPIVISFWMVFSPPPSLSGNSLVLWMACAVIGFYSAQTIFIVPHFSLGAELTDNYHERNKIFGARHAGWIFGYTSALYPFYLLIQARAESVQAARTLAESQSITAGLITVLGLLVCAVGLRERKEFSDMAPSKPFRAFIDVWKNKHAKLLLIAIFIETFGTAVVTILTFYNAKYVIERVELTPLFILSYMVFSFGLTPLWIPLARRVGKKQLWIYSMLIAGVAFGLMGTLGKDEVTPLLIYAALAGAAAGCGNTINPSIKADIIDYDEYKTGERKEGAYFAAWYFVSKMAYGIMLMVTGFALSLAGYVEGASAAAQPDILANVLRALYGGTPLIAFGIGAYLLSHFTFNEAEHKHVIAELAKRGRQVRT